MLWAQRARTSRISKYGKILPRFVLSMSCDLSDINEFPSDASGWAWCILLYNGIMSVGT